MVEAITTLYKDCKAYGNIKMLMKIKPRKEIQCAFHLMNIWFSDNLAKQFALLSEPASQYGLDTGKGGNDQDSWLVIESTFMEEDILLYDALQF